MSLDLGLIRAPELKPDRRYAGVCGCVNVFACVCGCVHVHTHMYGVQRTTSDIVPQEPFIFLFLSMYLLHVFIYSLYVFI